MVPIAFPAALAAVIAGVLTATAGWTQSVRWGSQVLRQPAEWYGSAEARAGADMVLVYQSEHGAWPKDTDLFAPIEPAELEKLNSSGRANTIDNGATTRPMRFLALVHRSAPDAGYRTAFARGVDYLLRSQYANGGFPQSFPLRGDGYHSQITYNDGVTARALAVLHDVVRAQAPYDLVDDELRSRAAEAVERGIDCILRTQVVQDGRRTAWCAQHDRSTLEPAWARSYEPPSLSGGESVGIVRFLMSLEEPAPEVVAAIDGAVAWFRSVAIRGVRQDRIRRDDGRTERVLVPDPEAPLLWARFYELGTNRPLYVDRDSVFRYDYSEISYERRSGYSYHGTWAASLLETEYPAWRERHGLRGP